MDTPLAATQTPRRPLRRFLTINLSSLLVLVALLAVWLARVTNRARLQAEVISELQARRALYFFDYQADGGLLTIIDGGHAYGSNPQPPGPAWLRGVVGDEYFRRLVWLSCAGGRILRSMPGEKSLALGPRQDDEIMRKLGALGGLRDLDLAGFEVTDRGLASLARQRELTHLTLRDCPNITNAGFSSIQGLPRLKSILIYDCPLTERSFSYMSSLPSLRSLQLRGGCVTDACLAHLRAVPTLEFLMFDSPAITDAGLAHLHGLANLTSLQLCSPLVTDVGLAHVATLPHLTILGIREASISDDGLASLENLKQLAVVVIMPAGPPLTDRALGHFKKLPELASLYIGHPNHPATQFSDEAVRDLLQSLPKLKQIYLEPANLRPELVSQLNQIRPGLRISPVR